MLMLTFTGLTLPIFLLDRSLSFYMLFPLSIKIWLIPNYREITTFWGLDNLQHNCSSLLGSTIWDSVDNNFWCTSMLNFFWTHKHTRKSKGTSQGNNGSIFHGSKQQLLKQLLLFNSCYKLLPTAATSSIR